MPTISLSGTPKVNGFQATVTLPHDGASINSAESYPTIAEALTAATLRRPDVPEREKSLEALAAW